MTKKINNTQKIFDALVQKGTLKQDIYYNTIKTFKIFKEISRTLANEYNFFDSKIIEKVPFEFKDRGKFEFELKFAGDVLVFIMHTNVFEFPRDHEVMRTSYVKEDISRSYCGIINIFNFLADSFKFKRLNDSGYLIGRIFINKDMHYFLEGKREIGLLYINFVNAVMNSKEAQKIIEQAILYSINFDLLTPPYNQVKEVSVHEMLSYLDNMKLKTAKRLGFKFQSDYDGTK